jgi:ABC-type dipeptide/oligopeptide/nickel transport system permease component
VTRQLLLVVVDVVVVVAISIGCGAWAPRWPDRWLDHDAFPLTRFPWESPAFFRRLRVPAMARRLPELGETFGGASKSAIPGRSREDMTRFLRELRRAEWVHWLSIGSSLVLALFNPWWLTVAFVTAVSAGNLPFLLVLRNNRFKTQRILDHKDGFPA